MQVGAHAHFMDRVVLLHQVDVLANRVQVKLFLAVKGPAILVLDNVVVPVVAFSIITDDFSLSLCVCLERWLKEPTLVVRHKLFYSRKVVLF